MKKKEIWITVYFDETEMDVLIANTDKKAQEIIKSVEEDSFENYYSEEIKEDWFDKFELPPIKVTTKITGIY